MFLLVGFIIILLALIVWITWDLVFPRFEKYTNQEMNNKVYDTAKSIFQRADKPLPKDVDMQRLINKYATNDEKKYMEVDVERSKVKTVLVLMQFGYNVALSESMDFPISQAMPKASPETDNGMIFNITNKFISVYDKNRKNNVVRGNNDLEVKLLKYIAEGYWAFASS